MPQTDSIQWLHGTPSAASNVFTATATTDYSDNELDFGAPATGGSYPYLPEFPSLTEKGYTFPPEVVGNGGVEMGIHLAISAPVLVTGGMTAGVVNALTSATTGATTVIASRTFTPAQLAIAGAHYFIPVSGAAILEFLRCNFVATSFAADSGTAWAWYGPKTGGEK
jgi:hypothetical protein